MDKNYLETVVMLSRMYGIAETLHPWDYLENEKFISKMREWTEEFLSMENRDLIVFFESKIE